MRGHRVEVHRDAAGEWRWHLKAGNGRVISDSGEGYTREDDAVRAAQAANPTVDDIRIDRGA